MRGFRGTTHRGSRGPRWQQNNSSRRGRLDRRERRDPKLRRDDRHYSFWEHCPGRPRHDRHNPVRRGYGYNFWRSTRRRRDRGHNPFGKCVAPDREPRLHERIRHDCGQDPLPDQRSGRERTHRRAWNAPRAGRHGNDHHNSGSPRGLRQRALRTGRQRRNSHSFNNRQHRRLVCGEVIGEQRSPARRRRRRNSRPDRRWTCLALLLLPASDGFKQRPSQRGGLAMAR